MTKKIIGEYPGKCVISEEEVGALLFKKTQSFWLEFLVSKKTAFELMGEGEETLVSIKVVKVVIKHNEGGKRTASLSGFVDGWNYRPVDIVLNLWTKPKPKATIKRKFELD